MMEQKYSILVFRFLIQFDHASPRYLARPKALRQMNQWTMACLELCESSHLEQEKSTLLILAASVQEMVTVSPSARKD